MVNETWVTKHPFWMSMIVSVIVSLFGIMFHYLHNKPHDWEAVFMWLPVLWFLVFLVPILNWIYEIWQTRK